MFLRTWWALLLIFFISICCKGHIFVKEIFVLRTHTQRENNLCYCRFRCRSLFPLVHFLRTSLLLWCPPLGLFCYVVQSFAPIFSDGCRSGIVWLDYPYISASEISRFKLRGPPGSFCASWVRKSPHLSLYGPPSCFPSSRTTRASVGSRPRCSRRVRGAVQASTRLADAEKTLLDAISHEVRLNKQITQVRHKVLETGSAVADAK